MHGETLKDVEGNFLLQIWSIVSAFTWRNWGKVRKILSVIVWMWTLDLYAEEH